MIEYKNLADAQRYYSDLGYKYLEVPWLTTKEVAEITAPVGVQFHTVAEKNKVLVASGEQSFLYLMVKGYLPEGKYQCITPCFRDDSNGIFHRKNFMKLELLDTTPTANENDLTNHALMFYRRTLNENDLNVIHNQHQGGFDIEYKGIELGSYGTRQHQYLKWAYGTGCAEPRLSYCQRF